MPKELKLVLKELFAFKRYLIIVAITGIIGAYLKGYISFFIKDLMDAAEKKPRPT